MSEENQTIYELIGGEAVIKQLVDTFYSRVEQDTELRSMFPDDLEPGKRWQFLFLMQLFGGPRLYEQERGHPRLRMRHGPFPIDEQARDAWFGHMIAAMDELGIVEPAYSMMYSYFERAATHMINSYSVGDSR